MNYYVELWIRKTDYGFAETNVEAKTEEQAKEMAKKMFRTGRLYVDSGETKFRVEAVINNNYKKNKEKLLGKAREQSKDNEGDEERSKCLECGKWFTQDRDIELCDKCVELFDLDKLWEQHDNNKLDALDFNESGKLREKFRKKW